MKTAMLLFLLAVITMSVSLIQSYDVYAESGVSDDKKDKMIFKIDYCEGNIDESFVKKGEIFKIKSDEVLEIGLCERIVVRNGATLTITGGAEIQIDGELLFEKGSSFILKTNGIVGMGDYGQILLNDNVNWKIGDNVDFSGVANCIDDDLLFYPLNGCVDQNTLPMGDIDGDRYTNEIDNCPDVYNPGQKDSNGSGTGDACETIWTLKSGNTYTIPGGDVVTIEVGEWLTLPVGSTVLVEGTLNVLGTLKVEDNRILIDGGFLNIKDGGNIELRDVGNISVDDGNLSVFDGSINAFNDSTITFTSGAINIVKNGVVNLGDNVVVDVKSNSAINVADTTLSDAESGNLNLVDSAIIEIKSGSTIDIVKGGTVYVDDDAILRIFETGSMNVDTEGVLNILDDGGVVFDRDSIPNVRKGIVNVFDTGVLKLTSGLKLNFDGGEFNMSESATMFVDNSKLTFENGALFSFEDSASLKIFDKGIVSMTEDSSLRIYNNTVINPMNTGSLYVLDDSIFEIVDGKLLITGEGYAEVSKDSMLLSNAGFIDVQDLGELKGDVTCSDSMRIYDESLGVCVIPDSDGDGFKDNVDNCPATSNPRQADLDDDGKGDVCDGDRDGDGYKNRKDNCPDISNPKQVDSDDDGLGDMCETDGDGDGYVNVEDNCPIDYNPSQQDIDGDGLGDVCDISHVISADVTVIFESDDVVNIPPGEPFTIQSGGTLYLLDSAILNVTNGSTLNVNGGGILMILDKSQIMFTDAFANIINGIVNLNGESRIVISNTTNFNFNGLIYSSNESEIVNSENIKCPNGGEFELEYNFGRCVVPLNDQLK